MKYCWSKAAFCPKRIQYALETWMNCLLPSLYTAYEHETKRPGFVSPFYASSPGHSFLAQILDEISQLQPKSLLTPFMSVGNQALRDFIKKWDPDISIFPSYFFNPTYIRGKKYNGDGPIRRAILGNDQEPL